MFTILSFLIYGFEVMMKVLGNYSIAVTWKALLVMAAIHSIEGKIRFG